MPDSNNIIFHNLFGRVYTWNEDLVDNYQYFKLNYYAFDWLDRPLNLTFKQKKLLILLSGNKKSDLKSELYSARRKIIDFFESSEAVGFDFYGSVWDFKKYKNYVGNAANRIECMSNVTFPKHPH
jgi:hypothetical protein